MYLLINIHFFFIFIFNDNINLIYIFFKEKRILSAKSVNVSTVAVIKLIDFL